MLDIDSFSSMLSSFTKINVELNFASGAYLLEFPKARIGDFLAGKTYLKSEIMSILESSAAEKVLLLQLRSSFMDSIQFFSSKEVLQQKDSNSIFNLHSNDRIRLFLKFIILNYVHRS